MCDHAAEAARAAAQTLLPAWALASWRRRRQARTRQSMLDADSKAPSANEEGSRDNAVEVAASMLILLSFIWLR